MTQAQTTTQGSKQASSSQKSGTPQQRHLQAAALHDQASIHHKEAAQHLATGDQKSAMRSAQLASEHTIRAFEQCAAACKEGTVKHSAKN